MGIVTPLHGCHYLVVVVTIPCIVVTTACGCCQVCGGAQVQGHGGNDGSVLPHPRDHDRHPLLPPRHHLRRDCHLVSTRAPPGEHPCATWCAPVHHLVSAYRTSCVMDNGNAIRPRTHWSLVLLLRVFVITGSAAGVNN